MNKISISVRSRSATAAYPAYLMGSLGDIAMNNGGGSKAITEDLFEILGSINTKINIPRIELAISRAKKIYNQLTHASPATEESSTTVFRLVEEIMKFI